MIAITIHITQGPICESSSRPFKSKVVASDNFTNINLQEEKWFSNYYLYSYNYFRPIISAMIMTFEIL